MTDSGGIGPERRAPQLGAQHHRRRTVRTIFISREFPAEERRDPKDGEESGSDALLLDEEGPVRAVLAADDEVDTRRPAREDRTVDASGAIAHELPRPSVDRCIAVHGPSDGLSTRAG